MAPQGDTSEQPADQRSRCEIYKIRKVEGECLRPGEIQLDGSMLCVRHAELLRLEDHSETLLGEVFEMDQWLESVDGQVDELRVRRAEHHRNELREQIRFNRARIELIHNELQDMNGALKKRVKALPDTNVLRTSENLHG